MSSIKSYADLLDEKKRLEELLLIQKEIVHKDIAQMREELRPVIKLLSMVGKISKLSTGNPLISTAVTLAGEMLLGNALLSRGTKITRLVVPFLAKKVTGYFLENGSNLIQKLTGMWKNYKSNGHPLG